MKPVPTDPDVQFSRIRFFGCTRFRADLHSCPLQDPMAIPRSEVGSCIPSPTCPARVSFVGYVLPSGPFPCGRLSLPLSTMPDKTPRGHIAALRRPTWPVIMWVRSTTGLPEFYGVSLLACHGLLTPADLHILAYNECFCVAFGAR
jgi:hypothetical protein